MLPRTNSFLASVKGLSVAVTSAHANGWVNQPSKIAMHWRGGGSGAAESVGVRVPLVIGPEALYKVLEERERQKSHHVVLPLPGHCLQRHQPALHNNHINRLINKHDGLGLYEERGEKGGLARSELVELPIGGVACGRVGSVGRGHQGLCHRLLHCGAQI